jgi:hypothetical protein
METCPHCQQQQEPRIDLRQVGAEDPQFGGSTGVRRMIVCSNASCNQILRPYGEVPVPQVTAEDIEGITTLGDMAAALGVPGPQPQPVSMNSGAGFEPAVPVPIVLEKSAEPPTADDIESDARRRLEFVRTEIAKLRGYESEEARLELMLSALAPASQERATG